VGPDLKAKADRLPRDPGVYLFLGRGGRVLYVGKAKDLRARVGSYFGASTENAPKTRAMLARAVDLDFVVTITEKEALILEAELIRQHRPRYNVDLRDDKRYPALRLATDQPYPNLTIVRRRKKDGAKYFGPFASAGAVRQTLALVHKVFPLRQCRQKTIPQRDRPCLNYQMKRCLAPCQGYVSPQDYAELVRQVEFFITGRNRELEEKIEIEMQRAAAEERFEDAAVHRDRLFAVRKTLEKQRIVDGFVNRDVIGLHEAEAGTSVCLMMIRNGVLRGGRNFWFPRPETAPGEILSHFIRQHYPGPGDLPAEITASHPVDDADLIAQWLSELAGRRVGLIVPQRGDKKRLVEMAVKNAASHRPAEDDPEVVLTGLETMLGLGRTPERIEAVDISHLGGALTVGSVVTFVHGRPLKSAYRRVRLEGEGPPDDYDSMYRVLGRRLAHEPLPDLLLVDGGKGQLNVARRVLRELALEDKVAVAAMAKDRGPGQGTDRVFIPGRKDHLGLKADDHGLRLLAAIRDEAHRFAVSYHRLLRRKAATRSILDEVPGLGPKRRAALLKHFGSLARIKKAGVDELSEAPGMTRAAARTLASFLAALEEDQSA
jgi:excinuclease ABC subunit C